MDDPVADRLFGILAKGLGADASEFKREMRIVEDLQLDAYDFLELTMEIEDAFEFRIDADVRALKTIGDLVEYLRTRQGVDKDPARLKPRLPENPDEIDPPHEA